MQSHYNQINKIKKTKSLRHANKLSSFTNLYH